MVSEILGLLKNALFLTHSLHIVVAHILVYGFLFTVLSENLKKPKSNQPTN